MRTRLPAGKLPPANVTGSKTNNTLTGTTADPRCYSTAVAAKMIGVCPKKLRQLERERGCPKSLKALRKKLWPHSELVRFVEESR